MFEVDGPRCPAVPLPNRAIPERRVELAGLRMKRQPDKLGVVEGNSAGQILNPHSSIQVPGGQASGVRIERERLQRGGGFWRFSAWKT